MKSQPTPARRAPRRAFVTRLIAAGAALPLFASVASAQPNAGQGRQGQARQGQRGQGRQQGGRPDPARMAARLITEFDRDGDGALNAGELAAALVALHERRPGARGQGRRGQGSGARQAQ